MANHKGTRREYTREEIELAIRLHEREGLEWVDIAARLGRGRGSLAATVCNFRKGKWQPGQRRQKVEQFRADLERLVVEEGVFDTGVLAERVGSYRQHVTNHLLAIGLDGEMRREIRAEFMQRAA